MDAVLKLSEAEVKCFGELFTAACDADSIGNKVSGTNAAELFKASQLPPDTLQQIIELCGAKRLGHYGRSQFYVALKLIAAAQLGLPLKLEIFNKGLDIPLPKFTRITDTNTSDKRFSNHSDSPSSNLFYQQHSLDGTPTSCPLDSNHSLGQLPPPPTKNQLRSSTACNSHQQQLVLNMPGSPNQSSAAVQALVPDLLRTTTTTTTTISKEDASPPSAQNPEKDWAAYVVGGISGTHNPNALDGFIWHQFEDEKQLLTTEDEASEQHSSDESAGVGCDVSRDNTNDHRDNNDDGEEEEDDDDDDDDDEEGVSGFDDDEDIWAITDEQREYYVAQFRSLQADISGLISGVIAKEFFEKSKLPVQELSKIWQLSDVNKDGALSLEEFFTAMHLVVLRRNNVELPETLPSVLVPHIGKEHQLNDAVSRIINNNDVGQNGFTKTNNGRHCSGSSPQKSEPTSPHAKDWTHFNESPISSTVSSPGVKPVNFDFKKSAVEQDPKIFHPVPLRISPDSQIISSDETYSLRTNLPSDPIPYEQLKDQPKVSTNSTAKWVAGGSLPLGITPASIAVCPSLESKLGPPPQAAIQRPIVKKTSLPGPGALPPPPQIGLLVSPSSDDPSDGNFPFLNSSFSGSASTTGGTMSASYHQGMTSCNVTSTGLGPKKEPPPPPPPRPKRNHTRSSSLDLNRLVTERNGLPSGQPSSLLGAPPAVPPRMSPSTTTPKKLVAQKSESDVGSINPSSIEAIFANFHEFPLEIVGDVTSTDVLHSKAGAFEVYRRPSSEESATYPATNSKVVEVVHIMKDDAGLPLVDFNSNEETVKEQWNSSHTIGPRDKRELQSSIRSHRDRNFVLSRLNTELNQELAEVMEERIALEIQLEHLKPYSN